MPVFTCSAEADVCREWRTVCSVHPSHPEAIVFILRSILFFPLDTLGGQI